RGAGGRINFRARPTRSRRACPRSCEFATARRPLILVSSITVSERSQTGVGRLRGEVGGGPGSVSVGRPAFRSGSAEVGPPAEGVPAPRGRAGEPFFPAGGSRTPRDYNRDVYGVPRERTVPPDPLGNGTVRYANKINWLRLLFAPVVRPVRT